jgi:TonB-dependent receptor
MRKIVTEVKSKTFLRGAVLCGVSTLAVVALAGPAMAQTTPSATTTPAAKDDSTVVVVTGIRASLQRAMNIKKNSDGVVDGISAEDVGKYPDTNLADSLQRITGVSINRVDGEGEQITVRGFGPQYNSTTVDGRIMPATDISVIGGGQGSDSAQGNTRAFDFANIASDGVQSVEVYKTGRADIDSGGIGASINVVTLQPLAHPGTQASLTVKGLTSDNPGLGTILPKKTITPEISGAYQWTNDSGKFGVAAFGSYQEKTGSTRSDTVNHWTIEPFNDGSSNAFLTSGSYQAGVTTLINAPTNPNQLVATPSDSRYTYAEDDTKRTNGEVVLQWRPTEELTVTANSFYAQTKEEEARSELTNWFSQSPYKSLTFDGNNIIDSAVVVVDKVPTDKDQGYENELRSVTTSIQSNGLKLKYHPNDNWTFTADLSASYSTSGGGNSNGTTSTTVSVAQEYVGTDTTTYGNLAAPVQNVTLNLAESPTGKQDIASISSGYSFEDFSKQTDKIEQAKFDAEYSVDDNSKLSAGIDIHDNTNEEQYSQIAGRFGDWSGTNPGDLATYGGTAIKTFCMACQFNSVSLAPNGNPDADTAYRFNAVNAFAGLAAYYGGPNFKSVLPGSTSAAPGATYLNGFSHNKVQEDVTEAYMQFSMKSEFLSRPLKILAGVRYEETNVDVTAYQNIPTAIEWTQKNNFNIVQGSAIQPYAVKSNYSELMPSFDAALDITDNLIGRISFSTTEAPPPYSSMYATTSVNAPGNPSYLGYVATASSGNPSLKPLTSDNFDASLEWYYGKNSYVSLGYYRKAVQNFIGTGVVNSTLFGLTDPSSGKAGTRSGTAVTALQALATAGNPNAAINTNSLFVMTALVDRAGGNAATASQEFNSLTDPAGHTYTSFGAFEADMFANYPVIGNSTDPVDTFEVSEPINNHTANIDGFEFAVQHFFGDTGFGVAASATTVNGDVKLNDAANPNGVSQFALEGLSNTYNITGIYEKYGWSGRIVYNWRDKYLTQANAAQFGGLYTAAYGQWDASVNYNLTPKVTVSLEALNINKEHVVEYIRVPADVVDYQELDTRYELGLRYKF